METVNNFYSLISEKTEDFSGRKWVFDEIDNWLSIDPSNRQRYFLITGKAGSGKSTIAARLIEISNGIVKKYDEQDIGLPFKKIEKDFLGAFYIISFKDNLSTDPKTFSQSLSKQLSRIFAQELISSIKTSNVYDIKIDASQQQIEAQTVSGGSYIINIHGSPTAISVFNELVRTPLESFLKKSPQNEIIILIDGLDESITSATEVSDNIVSVLSNLESLKNVYFVMTTRDYDNILNKFNRNSLILDISSNKYINYVNKDVSSFIRLNINKKKLQPEKYQGFTDDMIDQLVKKAKGNFLYLKFVMDAFVEGKITFSQKEIDKIPVGLYGMYGVFFDRMLSQYGENSWGTFYLPIIRSLLVSFEGFNSDQISFFTGIEDNLQQILINLKPFIIMQKSNGDIRKSNSIKYKLYHQSLVEFLKTEYLEGDSQNNFYIPEQRGHKIIVEKYYDKTAGKFKINLLNEYGLRYLPDHLFALFDYVDPEGIDWYTKLLGLAKDKEFEEQQLQYFPFETNLPLITMKRAYEASIERDDPVSTVEMILIYANNLKKIFLESPFSILKNTNLDNNDILEKSWRIADLYDGETRVNWYLLIVWYFNCKNKIANVQKTLDRLFGKELVSSDLNIIGFFVYSLYDQYKDKMVKIFDHISNDSIYEISSFFFKNNNLRIGLEIFNYVRDKKANINNYTVDVKTNEIDTEKSLIAGVIEKSNSLRFKWSIKRSQALSSIAQSLAQSNKTDEAIKIANTIEAGIYRSQAFSSIAQSLVQSNKTDEAIKIANTLEAGFYRSEAISSIAQSLAQSNKLDEAINIVNTLESYIRPKALSSIAQLLVQSNKPDEAAKLFDEAIKIANTIEHSYIRSITLFSIAQLLAQSNKIDEAIKIANTIEDNFRPTTLSFIAQSLAQSNKLDEAIKIANTLEESYIRSPALSSIAQSLAQSNKLDEAIKIANTLEEGFRSHTLSSIAQSLAESNRPDDAAKLFDEVIKATKAIDSNSSKAAAIWKIAQSLAQSNRPDEAAKLFDEAIKIANTIVNSKSRSKALSSIAQLLVQSNRPDDAAKLFDEAIKIANTIEDSYIRSPALSSIAQLLVQSNRPDYAAKLFDEAIKIANTVEDSFRPTTLSSIAQSLAQSNKTDEAIKIANTIEAGIYRSQALSSIAQSLAQSNKTDEAIKIANTLEAGIYRSQAFSSIAQSLVQSNKIDEAIKIANTIEERIIGSPALSSIAQSLAQSNKTDEAAKLFDEAIKVANMIKDSNSRSKALSSIAQSLVQSNKLDEAIKIANTIEESYDRSRALSEIIAEKLEIRDNFSKLNLQNIIYKVSNLFDLSIAPLGTQELWSCIMKQCIGYPEIAYDVCLFVAEHRPEHSKEIADLILKHNF